MKIKILALLIVFLSGCTFIYDSRNQNSLNLKGAEYQGTKLDKGLFKTGRYIELRIMNKKSTEEKQQ